MIDICRKCQNIFIAVALYIPMSNEYGSNFSKFSPTLVIFFSLSHLPLSLFVILAILGGILLWFGFEFN